MNSSESSSESSFDEIYIVVPLTGVVPPEIAWNPLTDCAHCGKHYLHPRHTRPYKFYGHDARVCRQDDECAHMWRERQELRERDKRACRSNEA